MALFKESMSGLCEAQRSVVETGRVVCEQAGVWVEMVDPRKEVEYFVERARTGNRRVGAVVREDRGGEKVGVCVFLVFGGVCSRCCLLKVVVLCLLLLDFRGGVGGIGFEGSSPCTETYQENFKGVTGIGTGG